MIKHIVFTKFRDPDESVPAAIAMFADLPGKIPEIRSIETGRDVMHSERNFDMALIVTFDDLEALKRYDSHPAHQEIRAYIKARRTASATVDFEF